MQNISLLNRNNSSHSSAITDLVLLYVNIKYIECWRFSKYMQMVGFRMVFAWWHSRWIETNSMLVLDINVNITIGNHSKNAFAIDGWLFDLTYLFVDEICSKISVTLIWLCNHIYSCSSCTYKHICLNLPEKRLPQRSFEKWSIITIEQIWIGICRFVQ